jgi:hypothetical protein
MAGNSENKLNLRDMAYTIDVALDGYNEVFGPDFEFKGSTAMQPMPEKGYTAKSQVPVLYRGSEAGLLICLLFSHNDGTGSGNIDSSVEIPFEYKFKDKPERVLPRDKSETIVEAMLPLFSFVPGNSKIAKYTVSLEELTVRNGGIVKAWDLGLNAEELNFSVHEQVRDHGPGDHIIERDPYQRANLFLTVGDNEGYRFGDPHSIFCAIPDFCQVVGFLAVNKGKEDNPLLPVLNEKGKKPPVIL